VDGKGRGGTILEPTLGEYTHEKEKIDASQFVSGKKKKMSLQLHIKCTESTNAKCRPE